MNFLQLCQRVAQETGVSANSTVALPITVVGQSNELKRIVDWTADAWRKLQGEKKWNWQWEQASLTMLATTSSLAGSIPESRYEKDSLYLPVAGQQGSFPGFIPWDDFRLVYPFAPPGEKFNVWTVAPDGSIRVDQAPTANVAFTVERYKLPTELAADTDTPEMPADLHMLIVHMAVMRYANFDEAGVQRAVTIDMIRDMRDDLYKRCLPDWRMGPPMGEEDNWY